MGFKKFLEERQVDVGSWIMQPQKDYEVYAYVYAPTKGSFKAITIDNYGGKFTGQAASKSIKGWYPNPKYVDKKDVPAQAIKKIEAKADKLGVEIK